MKESAHRSNCAVGFFQDVFPIFATYRFNGGIDCIDQLSLAMPLGRRAPYSILQVVCLVDHYHLDFLIHQAVLAAVDSKEMCSEEILVTEDTGCWPLLSCGGWLRRITEGSSLRRDDKYRFSLSWGRDTAEKIAVGDLLEKLKNHKSDLIVQAVWEFIGNHPEVMAENTKIVIAVQSTQTDEQTLAQIQRMIDASMERLKDSMKLQVLQEQHGGQTAHTGPNQRDLDDMLDNLTIFDQ